MKENKEIQESDVLRVIRDNYTIYKGLITKLGILEDLSIKVSCTSICYLEKIIKSLKDQKEIVTVYGMSEETGLVQGRGYIPYEEI